MGSLKKYYFGKSKFIVNTFIGGVSATINTPALVASRLGIAVSRVKGFSIIGADIQFAITGGNYNIQGGAFQNNTEITYYHDADGLVTSMGNYAFRYASNLYEVKLKNLLIVSANGFDGTALRGMNNDFTSVKQVGNATAAGAFYNISSSIPTVINLPNLVTCTGVGAQANFGGHATLSNNLTFNVPLALMTSNAGKPDLALSTPSLRAVNINYIGYDDDSTFNTEIGNYTGGFTNKGLFAQFLGTIGSGAILNWRVDGLDIKCKILANYTISGSRFSTNTLISHYYDLDGLITMIGSNAFYRASNFKNIKIKNATTLNSYSLRESGFVGDNSDFASLTFAGLEVFTGCISVININFPAMTNLGGSVVNNGVFNGIKTGAKITVPIALQTINAGAPDGDLVYAQSSRGATIIYV